MDGTIAVEAPRQRARQLDDKWSASVLIRSAGAKWTRWTTPVAGAGTTRVWANERRGPADSNRYASASLGDGDIWGVTAASGETVAVAPDGACIHCRCASSIITQPPRPNVGVEVRDSGTRPCSRTAGSSMRLRGTGPQAAGRHTLRCPWRPPRTPSASAARNWLLAATILNSVAVHVEMR